MKPNILYLHCHDAGRYVQPYGYAIKTPSIQDLAEQGILFRQAFSAAPTCSPSRAALVTGQWSQCCGMLGLAHRGFSLSDYSHHINHTLRRAGYATALSGFQHVARAPFADPVDVGYDEILAEDEAFETVTAAAEAYVQRKHDKPFFLSVGFIAPHRHREDFWTLYPPDDDRYLRPPDTLPDTPETRKDMALYHASVRSTDTCMGRVLDALDRGGLADNTLVICTTDHGIAFPEMKSNLTDHGIGVMLILRGPGGFTGGKVIDGMVSQIDIFPTICELLGIDAPAWLQGRSMMPLVRGEQEEINEAVFAEISYHAAYEPCRCVRTKRWKYIRRFDGRDKPVLSNLDNGPSKAYWVGHGWHEKEVREESLYDLVFDPLERCNVIDRPSLATVAEEMRGRLDDWMRENEDPLLQGPIPLPEGARVTDPDDYSPSGGWPEHVTPPT
jgi:N-sulfoglucosamine sulfohydrolase